MHTGTTELGQISYSYSVLAPLSNVIPPLNTLVQLVHLRVPQSKVFMAEDLKKSNIPTSNL